MGPAKSPLVNETIQHFISSGRIFCFYGEEGLILKKEEGVELTRDMLLRSLMNTPSFSVPKPLCDFQFAERINTLSKSKFFDVVKKEEDVFSKRLCGINGPLDIPKIWISSKEEGKINVRADFFGGVTLSVEDKEV
ncbi:MAG: hypothetical protein KGI80_04530 [Verrucomicrobiota bacterium]|nr:hypothetical protein [Verrucomicrobiota bacterium]